MDYLLYICFIFVVLLVANGIFYFIGGLIGLKNSPYRIAVPFGITFIIIAFLEDIWGGGGRHLATDRPFSLILGHSTVCTRTTYVISNLTLKYPIFFL